MEVEDNEVPRILRDPGERLCLRTADIFANNTCITTTGTMYHDPRCNPLLLPMSTDRSSGNTFMFDQPAAFACGEETLSLASFHAHGREAGSTQKPLPTVAPIVALGKGLLEIK
jgi:hypothetical protein